MLVMVRSGQLRVRLPSELHDALAAEAERQGVSLNTLIVSLLAGGIGWKPVDQRPRSAVKAGPMTPGEVS